MIYMLRGKKTYIIALATVSYAVAGLLLGLHTPEKAVELVLAALGLGALRNGMVTSKKR